MGKANKKRTGIFYGQTFQAADFPFDYLGPFFGVDFSPDSVETREPVTLIAE